MEAVELQRAQAEAQRDAAQSRLSRSGGGPAWVKAAACWVRVGFMEWSGELLGNGMGHGAGWGSPASARCNGVFGKLCRRMARGWVQDHRCLLPAYSPLLFQHA